MLGHVEPLVAKQIFRHNRPHKQMQVASKKKKKKGLSLWILRLSQKHEFTKSQWTLTHFKTGSSAQLDPVSQAVKQNQCHFQFVH